MGGNLIYHICPLVTLTRFHCNFDRSPFLTYYSMVSSTGLPIPVQVQLTMGQLLSPTLGQVELTMGHLGHLEKCLGM